MTGEAIYTLAVLGIAVVLFASDRIRLDVVALLVLLALFLGGVITLEEALAGFSDPVVLMIAALFVVGEALATTGIAFSLGDWLMRVGGASQTRLLALLMATVAGIGAFMSSTGIVAIFIPIVLRICRKTGFSRSRLMMPLAFGALISGMMTLIATPPNLVVNAELRRAGLEPFGFFDFTPIGVAVLVVGIAFMLAVGMRLLPQDAGSGQRRAKGRSLAELAAPYGLADRVYRLRIASGSALVGQTLGALKLRTLFGVNVVGLERQGRFGREITPALPHTRFRDGDIIYMVATREPAVHFIEKQSLEPLPIDDSLRRDVWQELGIAEVLIAPDSKLIGRTLEQAAFRSRYHVSVLGIQRKGKPIAGSLVSEPLQFGDVLLVSGAWKDIGALQADRSEFLVLNLPEEVKDVAPARRRAPLAIAIMVAMIVAMTFDLVPNVVAVMVAALAMVAVRTVSMDDAYRVINWPSLILIAGMLPLATALGNTGATALIADGLVGSIGGFGPYAMMAGLFVITAVVGLFVSNTATAVLIAPIAIAAALDMGVSPHAFAMTVAVAASAAFMTPVSTPVNTLVVAPGNYRFVDFAKVGVPMTILVAVVALILLPLLFPL
ncbi:MAG: SLC13 family permease [Rhodospirillales bacterium]|nr:MAG: SLC13 family permease [Rhodospirillales bacterium]